GRDQPDCGGPVGAQFRVARQVLLGAGVLAGLEPELQVGMGQFAKDRPAVRAVWGEIVVDYRPRIRLPRGLEPVDERLEPLGSVAEKLVELRIRWVHLPGSSSSGSACVGQAAESLAGAVDDAADGPLRPACAGADLGDGVVLEVQDDDLAI